MNFDSTIPLPSGRILGPGQPCFIVAELSGNHLGQLDRALALIREAKAVGADAVKLQTYTADTLTIDCDQSWFRISSDNPWKGRTLYSLYEEAHTPWEWHGELFAEARRLGLEVFSSPFDETAVAFLETLDTPLYKIASFELVDLQLLRRVALTGKPMILSTGMACEAEIHEALETILACGNRQVILLKCTSAYPAPASEMNVRTIGWLAERFHLPVGLSDHSISSYAAMAAVGAGACVVEKHFTLSRAEGGADAQFSLEPKEFAQMVQQIRHLEQVLGEAKLGVGVSEAGSKVFRRSIFVVKSMEPGDVFSSENIRVIRPGFGLAPKHLSEVLGRHAAMAIARGTPLSWDMVKQ